MIDAPSQREAELEMSATVAGLRESSRVAKRNGVWLHILVRATWKIPRTHRRMGHLWTKNKEP